MVVPEVVFSTISTPEAACSEPVRMQATRRDAISAGMDFMPAIIAELRAVRSLGAQCDHRVDPHGAAYWHVAGAQGGGRHRQHDGREHRWIRRGHAEEEALEQPS